MNKQIIIDYNEYLELEKCKKAFDSLKYASISYLADVITGKNDIEISNCEELISKIQELTTDRDIRYITIKK